MIVSMQSISLKLIELILRVMVPGRLLALWLALTFCVCTTTAQASRSAVGLSDAAAAKMGSVKAGSSTVSEHYHSEEHNLSLLPNITGRLRPPTFSTCSSSQITFINGSINRVEKEVVTATNALRQSSAAELSVSPRYRAWFGEFDDDRHSTVIRTLSNMQQVLDSNVLDFDCTCLLVSRDFLFGFIRQSRPFNINMCPLFFSIEDEDITTLVHELSHFLQIGGTEDVVFGPEDSRQLALSDPDSAVRNADNYGYFISNMSPPLTIADENAQTGSLDVPQASSFEPLLAGESVTGVLAEGERSFYRVSDTSALTLESIDGDADLLVFSDADLNELLCNSRLQITADICALQPANTHYAVVTAFSDASFTLGAAASRTLPISFEALASDQTINNTLALGEADYYRVPVSESLLLDSLSGDVDLSVFDSPELDAQSLICESVNRSVVSETDLCQVSTGTALFVRVFANEPSTYSLESRQIASDNGLPLNVQTLLDGDRVDTFVGDGEQAFYAFSGPGRIDLISQSGDADLIIRDVDDPDSLVCQSNQFSLDSPVDSCLVEAGSAIAVVFGFTPAEFSLVFTEGENLPENPDNTILAGSGGGGGGASGWLMLFFFTLNTFMWRRRWTPTGTSLSCV